MKTDVPVITALILDIMDILIHGLALYGAVQLWMNFTDWLERRSKHKPDEKSGEVK